MIPFLLPLLPLLGELVPDVVKWLLGDKAGAVSQQVADVITAVAGDTTPAAVAAALADPARAGELRVKLLEVTAAAEATRRQLELEETRAYLADLVNARAQTVTLASGHSPIAWAAPVVSVFVTLGFLSCTFAMLFLRPTLDPQSAALLNTLFGALIVAFGQVNNYWLGSSAGSATKERTMAATATALAGAAASGGAVAGPLAK